MAGSTLIYALKEDGSIEKRSVSFNQESNTAKELDRVAAELRNEKPSILAIKYNEDIRHVVPLVPLKLYEALENLNTAEDTLKPQ